jgi:hypothetical protein
MSVSVLNQLLSLLESKGGFALYTSSDAHRHLCQNAPTSSGGLGMSISVSDEHIILIRLWSAVYDSHGVPAQPVNNEILEQISRVFGVTDVSSHPFLCSAVDELQSVIKTFQTCFGNKDILNMEQARIGHSVDDPYYFITTSISHFEWNLDSARDDEVCIERLAKFIEMTHKLGFRWLRCNVFDDSAAISIPSSE